jgi:hypothetical protein
MSAQGALQNRHERHCASAHHPMLVHSIDARNRSCACHVLVDAATTQRPHFGRHRAQKTQLTSSFPA